MRVVDKIFTVRDSDKVGIRQTFVFNGALHVSVQANAVCAMVHFTCALAESLGLRSGNFLLLAIFLIERRFRMGLAPSGALSLSFDVWVCS